MLPLPGLLSYKFIDNDVDYSGNDLTGVADNVVNLGLDVVVKNFSFNTNYRHTGSIPLNDANSLYSDPYDLVNVRVNYDFTILDKSNLKLFGGVNNVFDTNYASQILPNAVGFGGRQPRYYYPGNPVNFYLGLNLRLH